jgi:23S rRNA A2030 N6-methylase RlmJ
VVDAATAAPEATILLWYPIKSWSRPHVLVRTIREAGVAATTLELITTPLEHKRNRLNGSGLLCVNVSEALVDALAPSLQQIGRRCATQQGQWSLHVGAWKRPVG